MTQPVRLGLTGGIGSGKSTLARMLADRGAAWIDADQEARSVTAPGGTAIPAIRQAFGDTLIDAAGALDRARMRELVFREPSARQRLEAIVHPLVGAQTALREQEAIARGARLLVFDIPLLVESGRWARQLDAVLVVDCAAETQIARVMARSGLERAAIEGILASQATRTARRAAADMVVYNDGLSLEALRGHAEQIAARFGL
ncbi:MAG: dephospho-CoA kinase [Acidovorax sp.]|nr:dephospho-CoA kinase [Acidovorax sp.]